MGDLTSAQIKGHPNEIKITIGQRMIGAVVAHHRSDKDKGFEDSTKMKVETIQQGSVYSIQINDGMFKDPGNQIIVEVHILANGREKFFVTEEIDSGHFKATENSKRDFEGPIKSTGSDFIIILNEII